MSQAKTPTQPRLLFLTGPCAKTLFPLVLQKTIIGRLPSSHLAIDDATVSRVHAQLVLELMGVFVEDLSSLQGTWVNGIWTHRKLLEPGDLIAIGDIVLEFQCD